MTDIVASIESPRYARECPAEWSELLAITEDAWASGHNMTSSRRIAAHEAYNYVCGLGNEEMEVARYYSLGLVMCGMSRALQVPEIRIRAVETIAQESANNYVKSYASPANRPTDLSYLYSKHAFSEAIVAGNCDLLSGSTMLAADALSYDVFRRKFGHDPAEAAKFTTGRIAMGGMTAESVSVNALLGARGALQHVLRARYGVVPWLTAETVSQETAIDNSRPTLDETTMRSIRLERIGRVSALLRIDEFKDREFMKDVIVGDGKGGVTVDCSKIPESPPAADGITVLHNQRLTCPAVQVHGLVAQIIEILPEVILSTREKAEMVFLSRKSLGSS